MTWEQAFAKQARSDLECYYLLSESNAPRCQLLHYLQMATEKLSRSRLAAASPGNEPPHSHKGFYDWLKGLKFSADLTLRISVGITSATDFRATINGLLATAQAIENLAPAIAHVKGIGMNPEYPWINSGVIWSPVDSAFGIEALQPARLAKLVRFIDACNRHFLDS